MFMMQLQKRTGTKQLEIKKTSKLLNKRVHATEFKKKGEGEVFKTMRFASQYDTWRAYTPK